VKNIVLLATRPGAGVHTIALNLGIGLTHFQKKVFLASDCVRLADWLNSPGHRENSLLDRNPAFSWQLLSDHNYDEAIASGSLDYRLYLQHGKNWPAGFPSQDRILALCVIDVSKADLPGIMALNQYLQEVRPDGRGIDLLVPNKVKPGEWSENSQLIFDLAEDLGWEKIADPIPHCEALHDLPKEHTSVWELPAQYNNRRAAFQRLVDRVLEMI